MKKVIIKDPDLCTGCRTCEAVCSTFHEGRCNPAESRIRVITYPDIGLNVPMSCSHCETPRCMHVCPTNAIHKDQGTKAVVINEALCIGCLMCISVCPIGGIGINPIRGQVIKCDLCGGQPTCVEFCSEGALQYLAADELDTTQKRKRLKKIVELIEKEN